LLSFFLSFFYEYVTLLVFSLLHSGMPSINFSRARRARALTRTAAATWSITWAPRAIGRRAVETWYVDLICSFILLCFFLTLQVSICLSQACLASDLTFRFTCLCLPIHRT
jgi:hypothetical protein